MDITSSLALNNMAVEMAGKSCYSQASRTFKDALVSLNMVTTPNSQELPPELIRAAICRQASPQLSSHCIPLSIVGHSDPLNVADLDELSHHETLPVSSLSLIRFEPDEHLLENAHEASDLLIAIVLNNLGVVTLCRATNVERSMMKSKSTRLARKVVKTLQDSAVKFFKTGLWHLQRAFQANEDPFILYQVISASVVVLKTVLPVLESCGRATEVDSCFRLLTSLCVKAHNVDKSGLFKLFFTVTTAAAA
jgi:hypothetical protein